MAEQRADEKEGLNAPEKGNPERGDAGQLKEEDVEGGTARNPGQNFGFNERSIRNAFVRKVFTIVSLMLLTNIAMILPVLVFEGMRRFLRENTWLQLIALLVFLVVYFVLVCCRTAARNYPCNLILLLIFTISAGVMAMALCAAVSPYIVTLTLFTTAATCAGIIVFAAYAPWDITSQIFIISAVTMAVFIFAIGVAIASIFVQIKILHTVLSCILCAVFMVHLALDIQMILGGRKYEISPEEYIFASLMLFVDIYEIFINMTNAVR